MHLLFESSTRKQKQFTFRREEANSERLGSKQLSQELKKKEK